MFFNLFKKKTRGISLLCSLKKNKPAAPAADQSGFGPKLDQFSFKDKEENKFSSFKLLFICDHEACRVI